MTEHPIYKKQVEKLDSFDSFSPSRNDPERIFTMDIGDGMELSFMSNASKVKSDVLRVGFHAAKTAKSSRVHQFSPVTMSRESGDSYILFSDPTLTISDKTVLSWYLGTPGVNPDDWMELFVRRAMEAYGAKYLLIEGSSGGGFTSLRFAARFRNAVAVPKIPQTDLFRYLEGPLALTMQEAGWQDWTYENVMTKCPQRFRIADIYNDKAWNRGNLVHYVQNVGDQSHVLKHLHPLLRETGAKNEHVFSALKGQFSISRPFTGNGHIAVPKEYWIAENKFAINRLKALRPEPEFEDVWQPPSTSGSSSGNLEQRRINISEHLPKNKIW